MLEIQDFISVEQKPTEQDTRGPKMAVDDAPANVAPAKPAGHEKVEFVNGEMLLGSLWDPRFRVVSPIQLRLYAEDGQVIAEAPALNEFGFGGNVYEAVRDIQRALAQLHVSLEQSSDRLGADLQKTWVALQSFVIKTATPGETAGV